MPVSFANTLMAVAGRHRPWVEAAGWLLSLIGFAEFGAYLLDAIGRDGGLA